MSNVTATSTLEIARDKLATLVSDSTAFRTRVGDGTPVAAAVALESVFKTYLRIRPGDDDHASKRPYAVCENICNLEYLLYAGGAQNYLEPQGGLWLYLTDNVTYPDNVDDSSVDFGNFAGGVMDDLTATSAVSDSLAIVRMRLARCARSPEELDSVQTPYWEALVEVFWES